MQNIQVTQVTSRDTCAELATRSEGCVCHRTLSRQNLQRFRGRAKECWNQFDEYDSQGLHCVKQTSEK